jgi:hypothetical protein
VKSNFIWLILKWLFFGVNLFYMVLNFEIHFYIVLFFYNFILIGVGLSFFYGVTLWNPEVGESNLVCLCSMFSFLFYVILWNLKI